MFVLLITAASAPGTGLAPGMWDDDSSREVISPDVLPRWSRGTAADAFGDDPLTAPAGRVPFAINSAMNRKVVFTRAPLWALEVDAIVVGNNESLSDRSGATGEVFRRAGPELELEVQRLEGCRTGESRLTAGYTLPATHIVHTVGPRYQPRFASAAECALHWCYRSALTLTLTLTLTVTLTVTLTLTWHSATERRRCSRHRWSAER